MSTDHRFDGDGPDATWRKLLKSGLFMVQRCDVCNAHQFPPSLACRHCGAARPAFVQASGLGTVYSTTTVRSREGDYNVSIIELSEGPRMMSRVEGDPYAVAIGQAVQARIDGGEPAIISFVRKDEA
ncbi:Zn-ribbon domain-containing OB-fold protein [Rhizobium sp. SSA_523]|uniref:Zn-ribbon domain-containing OB-fold protein n=1 Tax=Rhizobium sp. SSA_523 TaxID=2952477 RepID=UPI0020909DD3|nr:OB-fold domain-containing protein [Rhizobium sp. SSA_523]MCO5731648.1 OB-fold domain-containing protein [Rhizobium sp. SSA_523]WKC21846.1 OB-fold domain-containing protein [Rhizobium sp. SSA_523]